MSAVVAVAGGTGGVGRTIIEALIAQGGLKVFILGRKKSPPDTELAAPLIAVDYSDIPGIKDALEKNQIDTVISTLGPAASVDTELNLITASEQSSITRRYIPSIYGIPYTKERASSFAPAKTKLQILDRLETSKLEWSAIYNGYFLDYYGYGNVKTYIQHPPVVLDTANKEAGIPGSGNEPVVFTHTTDVAKFVARLLTLTRWNKESYIIGDKLTWKEFVQLAEKTQGSKYKVSYDSKEDLSSGKITELACHRPFYAFFPKEVLQGIYSTFGSMFANGEFDLRPTRTLNEEFPDIQPLKAKDVLANSSK